MSAAESRRDDENSRPALFLAQICYTLQARLGIVCRSGFSKWIDFGTAMILSSDEIHRRLRNGEIQIAPFDPSRLNPNGYNLALHNQLIVYEEIVLDAASPNRYRRLEIPADGLTLQPNMLYLGRTVEYTETRGLVPIIQGRSSLGRLGLFLNPGGATGDVGYCGTWTLEMHCVQPVRIYPGMQICQIYYQQLCGEGESYCSDKYQHSRDIQPSLMYREFGQAADETQLELNFGDPSGVPPADEV